MIDQLTYLKSFMSIHIPPKKTMSMFVVPAQHPVFILPDGAAECVRALPVWRGQCHPVSGTRLLV